MCGIVGIISKTKPADLVVCEAMLNSISHRGPDFQKSILYGNTVLGHCRLAIQDLHPRSNQPFSLPGHSGVLVFNGEIYNHLELRKAIEAKTDFSVWRTSSDTETLFVALSLLGIDWTLRNIDGMYSFVFVNEQAKMAYLVRDRYGEKPLFFSFNNQLLIFSSELKAFEYSGIKMSISRRALDAYLSFGFIPAPLSIYHEVAKLQPGSYIKLDLQTFEFQRLKHHDHITEESIFNDDLTLDSSDKDFELETLLRGAVRSRMLADVPVASFLSGGYDSSLLTALMTKEMGAENITTFSVGFDDASFDESEYAEKVAKYLGTRHKTFIIDTDGVQKIVEEALLIHDEPFADVSQIPVFYLCKKASLTHKVALTGDGADEFFGGYRRHYMVNKISRYQAFMKNFVFDIKMPFYFFIKLFPSWFYHLLEKILNTNELYEKLKKFNSILNSKSINSLYINLLSYESSALQEFAFDSPDDAIVDNFGNLPQSIMKLDQSFYLPNNIFTKSDIAAMKFGFECRAPFLDNKLVHFSKSLRSVDLLTRSGGKKILKTLAHKLIPVELLKRPKAGFTPPLKGWLEGGLNDWSISLLKESLKYDELSFIHSKIISDIKSLKSKNVEDPYQIWRLLVLINWYLNVNWVFRK